MSCEAVSRLALPAIAVVGILVGSSTVLHARPLLDVVIDLDQSLGSVSQAANARQESARLSQTVAGCPELHETRCLAEAVFTRPLASQPPTPGIAEHLATEALATGGGSCSARVMAALIVAELAGIEADAGLFRDHVVLCDPNSAECFESLKHGTPLTDADRQRLEGQPARFARVSAATFVAYYVDNLGARLAATDQQDAAERAIRSAIEQVPDEPRFHFNLGTLRLGRGEFRLAESSLDRAIAVGWNEAGAFVNRGVARARLGRMRAARRDFRRALDINPQSREAHANLRTLDSEPDSRRAHALATATLR